VDRCFVDLRMEAAPLLAAAHALDGVAVAADPDEADPVGMAQEQSAVP